MKQEIFHEGPLLTKDFPVMCYFHKDRFVFPMHYHHEVEMIFVESGEVSISVLQKEYKVKAGQLVIIGCNHIHSYNQRHPDEDSGFHVLRFDWKFFNDMADDKEIQKQLYSILFDVTVLDTSGVPGLKPMKQIFQWMSLETMNVQYGRKFILLGYLYKIMGLLIRFGDFADNYDYDFKQMEKEHELLSRVNAYIFEHYSDGITLTSAAMDLGYSEFHFARQFKRYTGITFKQYLTHYQISMAKDDVLKDEMTIIEVAYKHGFNSVKTFNRVFKNYYGMSPTAYRKEMNSLNEPVN